MDIKVQSNIGMKSSISDVKVQRYKGGMHHTSTALYFYRAFKNSLHKPRATSGNMSFHISYGFNYYLQLLCSQFLSTTNLNFSKFTFGIKIALFLKSLFISL
jgi:hypothetical protein